jgi:acyl-CoA thioester hydrolase
MNETLPTPQTPGASVIDHSVYYGEVDRMGYVYYGNYATWFERGRTDLLRRIGLPYGKLEDEGILLPVRRLEIRYHRPAHYEDEVQIVTVLSRMRRASVTFLTAIYRDGGALAAEGTVELACVESGGGPRRLPPHVVDALTEHLWESG